jgi:hypothetical protein
MMVKIGLRFIVVSAGVALVLLTLFSDLSPERVETFKDARVGSDVSIECVVVQCNHSKTGLILKTMDRDGAGASIFFPPSVLAAPVPVGSVIKVTVTPSEDDPTFLFASSFKLLT